MADLRYGTVSVNHWAAVGYGLVITPWGAFPGHTRPDIQSGTGSVHNTLMFDRRRRRSCARRSASCPSRPGS